MSTVNRRDVLTSTAALVAAVAVSPASIWAQARDAKTTASPLRPLLDDLCDAVIPATDTAGARAVGVGAFVELAAAHGMSGASAAMLSTFATALDDFAGGAYLRLPEQRRYALLVDIDARAFSKPEDRTLPEALRQWPKLKGLIVIGYYTSEVGATQELRYVLVPGRFDPDVPLQPSDRAFSSDWTGVKYA